MSSMSRIGMATKVLAMTTVARHLGTDLTVERARRADGAGRRFTWVRFDGGDHVVAVDSVEYRIDLVTGKVS